MLSLTRRKFLHASFGSTSLLLPDPVAWSQRSTRLTRTEWLRARQATLQGMQAVMGELPRLARGPVRVDRGSTETLGNFTRTKITYLSEPGDAVPAWLLMPAKLQRRAPAMLCLHQTTKIAKDEPAGVGGLANLQYARELAERGYVCLVPDYPYLGENQFDPYAHGYASCTMKGIWNHLRAVDLLQALPQVERRRIGVIGHSLGGHNALFVAAFDERLKAIVTSCGFTKFARYFGGDLTGWSGKRYMPRIAERYGKSPAQMPFDFPELLSALAPRALFINAPLHDANFAVAGVQECVAVAQRAYGEAFQVAPRLVAEYPDAKHDFPPAVRQRAFAFLAKYL